MESKVLKVLETMTELNINLPLFLDALSWGDEACIKNCHIQFSRRLLMHSKELPDILQHWWKPPKNSARRAKAGRHTMEAFAAECMDSVLDKELAGLANWFKSPSGNDTKVETLTDEDFDMMIARVRRDAPRLWQCIRKLAWTASQEKRNTSKDPNKIVLTIISILSYSRSHHRNKLQKMFAIYLKFRGLSAKAFDTLHALGLVMSHKWTCNAVEAISGHAMAEVVKLVKTYPFLVSYDNIQLAFRVFSQRLDNHGEFGNGTAATVYIKRDAQLMTAEINTHLRRMRIKGIREPLTPLKIFILGNQTYPRIRSQMVYQVLQFLFDAPEFGFSTYKGRDSELFLPPPPSRQLPHGPDHIASQFLLGSVNIPEASYHDHLQLIKEWLTQMGLGSVADKVMIALEKIIAFCGDQLTIDRLRGLFKFRSSDSNSYDRLDWMILVFGWFHLQMAFANALHKQYLGSNKSGGLKSSFTLLDRKGVQTTSIKGPFHHHLEEALYHIAEAHIRVDWTVVGKVRSLAELREKEPAQLVKLTEQLVKEHASSAALNTMNDKPEEQRDHRKYERIMFNRDTLHYIVLDHAIKHGNIGIMEDMLPHLLYQFYAIEVLELLQALHVEWPFVREHCWLLNFSGLPDAFVPVDQAQEHNIKDIKVTYRSDGPHLNWEYLKKLHPAIPVIRKKHTTPKREPDVAKLEQSYRESTFHVYQPGREVPVKSRVKDYLNQGGIEIQTGPTILNWAEGRRYPRSTEQDLEFSESESEGEDADDEREDDMDVD
ncbi:hypothetical protein C8J56DRAFT_1003957 [Mycena floridula]|nr:hypothetical protein C8J56DRAFT_1003957 [Mycena floridula]